MRRAEDRHAVIRVEAYKIVLGRIVLLEIGKECTKRAVCIVYRLPERRLIKCAWAQIGARHLLFRAGETPRKRQSHLCRRGDLERLPTPRMHIAEMEEDEVIRLPTAVQITDGTLDPLIGMEAIG